MNVIDCGFEKSDRNQLKIYGNTMSVMNAIKNLLLSSPGNFPFEPDKGIDIVSYQFEIANDALKRKLQKIISMQINKYIPAIGETQVTVEYNTTAPSSSASLTIKIKGTFTPIERETEMEFDVSKTKTNNVKIKGTIN